MNGSPLFTGDAGSGESEIRRWILENDWLEAIVALPEQLFYNTGIPTYVWVLTNRKPKNRKGKVQLIDATAIWTPMRKSLGDKRREITAEQIGEITRTYEVFRESENCRIFSTADFGYRKITVERPLRLNFQASPERIERLKQDKAFVGLATSKKKGAAAQAEIAAGKGVQRDVLLALDELDASRGVEEPRGLRQGGAVVAAGLWGEGTGLVPPEAAVGAVGAGRNRRRLHRRGGPTGAGPRTAGHGERAAD